MRETSKLSAAIRDDLAHIEPSIGMGGANTRHFPCAAVLKSGKEIRCVCFMERGLYMREWGVRPEDDPGKKLIRLEDVACVTASPFRLPPAFATRLYAGGESGMGYQIFTVQFRDGFEQAYLLGNLVDFIDYPQGRSPDDVVNILPHKGRNSNPIPGPGYFWCLYDE